LLVVAQRAGVPAVVAVGVAVLLVLVGVQDEVLVLV
jgi:hypothetical protein